MCPISNSLFKGYEENIKMSKRLMCGFKKYDTTNFLQAKLCFGITTNTHQSIQSHCKDCNDKSV